MLRVLHFFPVLLLAFSVVAQLHAAPKRASAEAKRASAETQRAAEYARLRAEYAASPAYNPQVPSPGDINKLRRHISQGQNDAALKMADALIAKNPVNAELHDYRAMALGALGRTAEAAAATEAKKGIQDAILMSGNGSSPDTAFQILNVTDIQGVIDRLRVRILTPTPQETTINGRHYYVITMQNAVQKKGEQTRRDCYFNIDPIVAWQKANPKAVAISGSSGRMTVPVKKGAGGGVKIGAATVTDDDSGDSAPQLVSTTGGGGDLRTWSNFAGLRKAANEGSPDALYELGLMYLEGSADTPKNTTQSLFHLERAAALGNRAANFRLGKLYSDGGGGVTQDFAKSYGFYIAAARAGDPIAQHNVGAMLSSGRGVKRDYTEGLAWLILAAQGAPEAVESEQKLRQFLVRRPEIITAAVARAIEIEKELAAKK